MSQLGGLSPYTIGGGLNFGTVPSQTDYMGAYSNALSLNTQNYNNILAGYQGLGQSQVGAQNQISQGYNTLTNQVMGDIQGIDASQRQALTDQYAQNSGNAAQGLINSGLGNTTVANSVQRGQQLDYQKANVALSNQMAQLTAGYQSSLGLAGLNYQNQANMQNTALGSQQLGFMNSVNSPYPNAQAYNDYALQQKTLALAQQGLGSRGLGGLGGGVNMGSVGNGTWAGLGGALGGAGKGTGNAKDTGGIQQGTGGYGGNKMSGDPLNGQTIQLPSSDASGYTDGYGNSLSNSDLAAMQSQMNASNAAQQTANNYPAYDPTTMNQTPDNSSGGTGYTTGGGYSAAYSGGGYSGGGY
jgi:hypothetical protein